MGPDRALQYLEDLQTRQPALATRITEFADLYQRKLWHQLTVSMEESLAVPEFRNADVLIPFYNEFIAVFAHKMNPLRLAQIAVTVAEQHSNPQDAVTFLNGVITDLIEAKHGRPEQPLLFLRMHLAQFQLALGQLKECKDAVEEGKQTLDTLDDVDPSVSAIVHYVRSQWYKHQKDFAEFYKSGLLYLAFISSDSLPADVKLSLAVDISLAALLGDNVYNFGELLLHPIMKALSESPYAWLREMLEAFNHGDLHAYDALCSKHAAALNAQPALVAHERKLREKITILCLMELIFNLPAEQRKIPLAAIAERTKLTVDGVEFLLMKTLSLHLIEGVIDQVDATVQVSWVQPRVLTLEQAAGMKARLDDWISKVGTTSMILQEDQIAAIA